MQSYFDQFEILGVKQIIRDYIEFVPAYDKELKECTLKIYENLNLVEQIRLEETGCRVFYETIYSAQFKFK